MSKALGGAVQRAVAIFPPLASQIEAAVRAADHAAALGYVGSEQRLTMLKAIWSRVPRSKRPELLAAALSGGDAPSLELMFVVKAMRQIRETGAVVAGSPADREFLAGLHSTVTAYRGTTQAEIDDAPFFGVCWTTDLARARWFATVHGRFRSTSTPPVLLTMTVDKSDIAGAVAERGESELFIDPAITSRSHNDGRLRVERIEQG